MIFAWVGAAVVGLAMGLLGSGGSILTIPMLVYLLGHSEKQAITEAFVIVGAIALLSAVPYAVRKQVRWRYVLLFGVPGMVGSYGGQVVAVFARAELQLVVLALLIAMAAYKMLFPRDLPDDHERPEPTMLGIAIDGLVVGLVTAFAGVGGGFMVVPVLVLRCRLTIHSAIGTALLIIALKSAAGFAKAVDQGLDLEWGIIAIFITIGVLGSAVGAMIAPRINQKALQKTFGCFLVLMAIFIGVKEGSKLLSGSKDVEQEAAQVERHSQRPAPLQAEPTTEVVRFLPSPQRESCGLSTDVYRKGVGVPCDPHAVVPRRATRPLQDRTTSVVGSDGPGARRSRVSMTGCQSLIV